MNETPRLSSFDREAADRRGTMRFCVKFWGVRGSIACPGPGTARYGGNTPCLELRCGDRMIILDGGTGLRPLGDALLAANVVVDADLFLSHCHLDHVSGLPFFTPLYEKGHRLRIWAGNLLPKFSLEQALRTMMAPPLFPIEVESFKAKIEYNDFRAGETIKRDGGVTLRTAMLNHPDGATGYRVEYGGRVLTYITDTELPPGKIDPALLELARDADLMIFDTTYTETEIVHRRNWGHSTWQDGARLADAAGAKTFCLFHHDPSHDDAFMDKIAAEAKTTRPNTIVAREGATVDL
jgi:phosphoribosyl 1,2-cyclic phosphodiesterase